MHPKSIKRLINFSDAVIAIAVTLLVLPLVDRAANSHISSYGSFVSSYGSLILIFIISFVVICRYWEVHHELFSTVLSFTKPLFWLNALWLLSIALIPFTSELLGNNSSNSTFIRSIYIVSLLLTSYIGVAIQLVIIHTPAIQNTSRNKLLDKSYGLVTAGAMTLVLIVNILLPSVGLWSLLLLIPTGYLRKMFPDKKGS
jgi:uncharacterized membrane protein